MPGSSLFFFPRVCQTPDSSNSLFRVIILTTPWLRAAIPYAASSALLTSTSIVLAPCFLPFQATPQCFPQVLIRICPVLGTLLLPCSVGLRPPLSRPPFVRNRSIVVQLQGESAVTAPPFFPSAGRGTTQFWGKRQGPAVFLWESLDEAGRKECEETMRTRRDWQLLLQQLVVQRILMMYFHNKNKTQKTNLGGGERSTTPFRISLQRQPRSQLSPISRQRQPRSQLSPISRQHAPPTHLTRTRHQRESSSKLPPISRQHIPPTHLTGTQPTPTKYGSKKSIPPTHSTLVPRRTSSPKHRSILLADKRH